MGGAPARRVWRRRGGCVRAGRTRYGLAMDLVDLSTPLGIALLAVGAFVAIKAVKTIVKLLMLVVIAVGVYLMFLAG